jgi:hypothetical protein
MQLYFPRATTPFERDLILQLTKYLNEINNKLEAQRGSAWDGLHPVMGKYHLWISSSGDLMIKDSQPSSDGDGQVIGTQT